MAPAGGGTLSTAATVPGNLIYANAHKFVPRTFHLVPEEPIAFAVDLANESIQETGGLAQPVAAAQTEALGSASIFGVQVCDVDAPHQSYISDDEDYRFQLPVAVFGQDQGAFRWPGVRVGQSHAAPEARAAHATGERGRGVAGEGARRDGLPGLPAVRPEPVADEHAEGAGFLQ